MSILRKNYDPGGAGTTVPGSPGRPPIAPSPGYCLDVASTVPGFKTTFVRDTDPASSTFGQIIPIVESIGPVTTITHECFPASAGEPGVAPGSPETIAPVAARYFAGWNASAISLGDLTGDGLYTFSIPDDAVGVVTGFDLNHIGSSYFEIGWGIYCASGQFVIMEGGAEKTPRTAFVSSDVFAIRRLGQEVAYYQNTTKIYTSTLPSSGTVIVDGALYFGNDSIVDAALSSTVPPGNASIGGGGTYDPPPVLTGGQPPPTPPGGIPLYVTVAGALENLRGFAQDGTGGGVVTSPPPVNPGDPGGGPGTNGGTDGNGDWPGRTGGVLRNLVGHAESYNNGTVGTGTGIPAGGTDANGDWPGRAGGQLRNLVGQAFGGDTSFNYAFCSGVLTSLSGYSESGLLQPSFAVVDGYLQPLAGWSLGFPANLMGTVNGVLGGLSGFATNLTGGQVTSDGPPPFPTVTTTLFDDNFTGSGTLANHQPDVGGAYNNDSASGIPADYALNGSGGLPSQTTTATDVIAQLQGAPSNTYTVSETVNITALGAASLTLDLGAGTDTQSAVDVALAWNGTTFTLDGKLGGGAVYDSGAISVTSNLGTGNHTIEIVVTPSGVQFVIDGTVIASTSDLPPITPDRINVGNHASAGTSNATIDSVLLTTQTPDAFTPDANGDWVGRIGGELRNLVGSAYSGIAATNYIVGQNSGNYPFLGIGHFGAPITDSDGNPAPLNGIQGAHHGNYGFAGYGHGDAEGTLPSGTFVGAGTLTILGEAIGTLPTGTFVGSGHFTTLGKMVGQHKGHYQFTGSGHNVAAGILPSGIFVGDAFFTNVGKAIGRLPRGSFVGSGHFDNFGSVAGILMSLQVVNAGRAIGFLPRGTFVGSGHWTVTVEYEGYVITLEQAPGAPIPSVATTHLTNYPFDRIVRWQGHYYGVGRDGIFLLEGATFDGAPIIATVRSVESDLGTPKVKRARSLFVTGQVGDDFAVQVTSNEQDSASVNYNGTPIKSGTRAHRYKLARGIKGNLLAFQFTNTRGKAFRVSKLTPEIEELSRTV